MVRNVVIVSMTTTQRSPSRSERYLSESIVVMTVICLTSVTLDITILEHLSEIFIFPHIFNLGGTEEHRTLSERKLMVYHHFKYSTDGLMTAVCFIVKP